jgi:hypothetical protein
MKYIDRIRWWLISGSLEDWSSIPCWVQSYANR